MPSFEMLKWTKSARTFLITFSQCCCTVVTVTFNTLNCPISIELLLIRQCHYLLSDHVSTCVLTDKLFVIQLQRATLSAGSLAEGIGSLKIRGFHNSRRVNVNGPKCGGWNNK